MKLYFRLIIAFGFCLSLGFYYTYNSIIEELRPRYLESVEEVLIDQSHILAEVVSIQSEGDSPNISKIKEIIEHAQQRNFNAKVYDLKKQKISLDIYITDNRGTVLFHSYDSSKVGRDFSLWRDVNLTLQGKYGARSSDRLFEDPSSSTLYVASPIIKNEKIIGVLTVCKPTTSINYFVDLVRPKLIRSGALIALGIFLLAGLVAFWVSQPIARLVTYATQVREGKNPTLPKLKTPEVREMGQAIQKMKLALEGKEYIEDYTHTLTHEIKSPLSSILGAAELLQEPMPTDKQVKFLKNIHAEGKRIQNLIDRMLELAQLENTKEKIELRNTSISDLLNSSLEVKKPHFDQKNIRIQTQISEDISLNIEPFLFKQALFNIIQNAIEFSPTNSTIKVQLDSTAQQIQISLEDQGPGIPEYALPKVLNKFFSLPRPNQAPKSTGLGLTFVDEICKIHKGNINLHNIHSKTLDTIGLKVTLTLPKT
ncbi:two-component system sensor histidine kinase CreC [bacterium]|nr:two-component system sensor histidine kinase CreC [bacterium]